MSRSSIDIASVTLAPTTRFQLPRQSCCRSVVRVESGTTPRQTGSDQFHVAQDQAKILQQHMKTDIVLKLVYNNYIKDSEARYQDFVKRLQKIKAKTK